MAPSGAAPFLCMSDIQTTIVDTEDKGTAFGVQHSQIITKEFLDELKAKRDASGRNTGSMNHLCEIPIAEYNELTRKGINPQQDPAAFRKWLRVWLSEHPYMKATQGKY